MKKKFLILLLILCFSASTIACNFHEFAQKGDYSQSNLDEGASNEREGPNQTSNTVFQSNASVSLVANITSPKVGDAKMFCNKIAAGSDGELVLFNTDGTVYKKFSNIPVNWLYPSEDDMIIVSGSFNHQILLTEFDDDFEIKNSKVLFDNTNLLIDPTITKYNDIWILTYIEINGTVNNSNPDAENGLYTVHCYTSSDLSEWTLVSDIISCKNNIEDGDLVINNDIFYYIFEKESYDKGPSSLEVISSKDHGVTWENKKTIISNDSDNELASVFPTSSGYSLYYSSDVQNPGKSYDGASVYCANLKNDFSMENTYEIPLDETNGILLYDVVRKDRDCYFLYSQNYITKNNLLLKKISLK